MSLLDFSFFVVGCPPVPDAVQAKRMEAVFEDSKSLSVGENWLKTYYAIVITLYQTFSIFIEHFLGTLAFNEPAHTVLKALWPHALRMRIFTLITIPTIALQKVFAWCPISIIFQEIINDIIVILQVGRQFIVYLDFVSGAVCRVHGFGIVTIFKVFLNDVG